jgi:hypothetical protein
MQIVRENPALSFVNIIANPISAGLCANHACCAAGAIGVALSRE